MDFMDKKEELFEEMTVFFQKLNNLTDIVTMLLKAELEEKAKEKKGT